MNAGNHIAKLLTRSTPSFEAERLILSTTEVILELMEKEKMTRVELAKRIGKSKGHISQLLNGRRNMTLKTLAEIVYALNARVSLNTEELSGNQMEDKGSPLHRYHLEGFRKKMSSGTHIEVLNKTDSA